MNSQFLEGVIDGDGRGMLTETLRRYPDDGDALGEIYLRILSREPTEQELTTCREHIASHDSRAVAYEDITWCLLNSSEFLTRR
ncbi:MAG: hypothetical protein R3B90_15495 [Planctomycetaceae bacterium]